MERLDVKGEVDAESGDSESGGACACNVPAVVGARRAEVCS